jgi:hypothetical protein
MLSEILQKSAGCVYAQFLFCGDCNIVQNKSDDTYNVMHDTKDIQVKKYRNLKKHWNFL